MKLADFFTRPTAETPRKLFLENTDGTVSTEFYMDVISCESATFRRAELLAKRRAVEAAGIDDQQESLQFQEEVQAEMLASLVTGWNLPEECTPESVKELLLNSGGNADRLSIFSATRSHWFAVKPASSSTGLSVKQD